ncbi:MAG: ATP-binding protein [Anaerolineae bacterium]|jgi:signal transduction histidine kinase|nr:ATP-binding protein [Anaerolineae bacterium]
MDGLLTLIIIGILFAHVVLGIVLFTRGSRHWMLFAWIGLSGLVTLSALLPSDLLIAGKFGGGFFLMLWLIALIGYFGFLMIRDFSQTYSNPRLLNGWLIGVSVWAIAVIIGSIVSPTVPLGQMGWLAQTFNQPVLSSIVLIIGLFAVGAALLGIGFYLFYKALLPELANRALFWILTAATLLTSVVLTGSGSSFLIGIGLITQLMTVISVIYAKRNLRIFDIRGNLSQTLSSLLLMIITAMILFGAFYSVTGLNFQTRPQGLLWIAILSVGAAAFYVPLRLVVEFVMNRLLRLPIADAAHVSREYSQQVSQAVEMNSLAHAASTTLNRAMRLRRSGLMLVNGTDDEVMELLMVPGGSFGEDTKGKILSIPLKSKAYRVLARDHRPLMQFDLLFDPKFNDLTANTRESFIKLQMNIYVPIVMDNIMMGVLACGPKINDAALQKSEVELLITLAQQTGFALRNARLVADLQHLNASMRSLNRGLEEANKELAKLDSVKSDFVTIASHELRTPLAQIRGYTDIIDAVNEQGMLDQEQTNVLVGNLRKATERMEELISAMLDVSQLDVNAMDLRFTQTPPDTLLRMAIEPLTDAIKQRKLTLILRGVKGLPPLKADLQRLVQAFRNIIVNAIKFTPDGGRIDIAASLQPAQAKDGVDHILITIADTGVGIAPEHIDLIFKKFYRTYDPSLHSTGTYKFLGAGPGLGLTIAKGVIEAHAGRIWAESPGHSAENFPGTTFYVLLPINPPTETNRSLTFETNINKPRN